MQFQFHTPNINLSAEQKAYAEEKIGHIEHLASRIEDTSTLARIDLKQTNLPEEERRYSCEVTIFVPGSVIRAEVYAATLEASIDLAEQKLRTQVDRYKSKNHRRGQKGEWLPSSTLEEIETESHESHQSQIVKRKRYESTNYPMSEEEAIEQLELVGHDFFLFDNADTGRYSVLYRRYTGGYGIVEPLLPGESAS